MTSLSLPHFLTKNILSIVTSDAQRADVSSCLPEAGPLATGNVESIADVTVERFAREGMTCVWKVLELAEEGPTVKEIS